MRKRTTLAAAATSAGVLAALLATPVSSVGAPPQAAQAAPEGRPTAKVATAVGKGGAVSTVDPEASAAALKVLKRGGNAVDAAVAAAATLGVTEPYSAGIGGGGYFVYYNAKSGKVRTIDGRETAPRKMPQDAFIDPATGKPYNFTPELVTSGVSVGTPGTLATWDRALDQLGHVVARRGPRPGHQGRDPRLRRRRDLPPADARQRGALPAPSRPPASCSCPRATHPRSDRSSATLELAATYDAIARRGTDAFYRGELAQLMSEVVRDPQTTKNNELPVPPGYLTPRDLRDYRVRSQRATKVSYRGHDVYGMAPSSSGGTTVGEALNILERYDLSAMTAEQALHHYLEASALAFADRGKYVGDPAYVDVPTRRLLDDRFAAERACSLDPAKAATKPVAAGDVASYDGVCGAATAKGDDRRRHRERVHHQPHRRRQVGQRRGVHPHHRADRRLGHRRARPRLPAQQRADRLQHGLRAPPTPTGSSPASGRAARCRPRSCSRTASPSWRSARRAASTIITTVLQMIVNRVDLGMSIQEAIAAPRATQRNTANVTAEPAFITAYGPALTALGHTLVPAGDAFTSAAEIGAATAIEFGPRKRLTAVAEPSRRGGGSAKVVDPR